MSSKRIRVEESHKTVDHAIWLVCGRKALKEEYEGASLTPLEKQVVSLRESIPANALLLVACGYRVKLYGRDSHVVSRRSGIMCIRSKPFEYSSVPYVRVELYIRRLVAMGYHVAFADQESAAVRAVEGVKCGIFRRTVSHLYSRGTLLPGEQIVSQSTGNGIDEAAIPEVDDEESSSYNAKDSWEDDVNAEKGDPSELFMCFIGLSTTDTFTPMTSVGAEILQVLLVSFVTRSRKVFLVSSASSLEDIVMQFDIVEVIVVEQGNNNLHDNQGKDAGHMRGIPEKYTRILQNALLLNYGPTLVGEEDGKCVSVSVYTQEEGESFNSAITAYLKPYKLDKMYQMMCAECDPNSGKGKPRGGGGSVALQDGVSDGTKSVLRLPGSTLRALEIFQSSIGHKGSLLSLLGHCLTLQGARTLRLWLAAPLASRSDIMERQSVIAYLLEGGEKDAVQNLLRECGKLGDVEAIIAKIHSQRCTVLEYLRLLRMSRNLYAGASGILASSTPPTLLESLLRSVTTPALKKFLHEHAAEMDFSVTAPIQLFTGKGITVPDPLRKHLEDFSSAQEALTRELERVREVLRLPGLEYRTLAGTSFVIDVPSAKASHIPEDWIVLTRTKSNVRYHTPTIVQENLSLCAAKDRLAATAATLWQQRQEALCQPGGDLEMLVGVIKAVAAMDVLYSLSVASSATGYIPPQLVEIAEVEKQRDGAAISIVAGRHPVLDQCLTNGYVSCDMHLCVGGTWLLTGPNMGGKSAFMRMVGCFVVMAQLGSYVPAEVATLPVFTGIYCRMGSSDAILEGNSTFFTEMEDTTRILRAPELARSLVFMDELGRGTSSFDGFSVAAATLDYLVSMHATCIFVTHYHLLCDPFVSGSLRSDRLSSIGNSKVHHSVSSNPLVECHYMGFRMENEDSASSNSSSAHKTTSLESDSQRVIFTYKPCPGVTPSSFGVEVAKMAGLPDHVIKEARIISLKEEETQSLRTSVHLLRQLLE
ncbi:unnamed protein product [Phytomonas sp. Hart1]|nr:unnamed protein product [Phytomonas sp. Hart1]|eukprot:CCW67813.1 unnamed protein product [Phytomonas sp. isolate Hart1]